MNVIGCWLVMGGAVGADCLPCFHQSAPYGSAVATAVATCSLAPLVSGRGMNE